MKRSYTCGCIPRTAWNKTVPCPSDAVGTADALIAQAIQLIRQRRVKG
jgi:hypothetical protein